MGVELVRADIRDASEIHKMQIRAFRRLLEKYQDYDTNPGNEEIEKVIGRIEQAETDYYLIKENSVSVGAIRIRRLNGNVQCRISPLFVLPEFQNRGIAQQVFQIIEKKYKPAQGWILDTILEEKGNCHLYEKMGYKPTGKTERVNERMTLVFYEKK
jgi:GNAT superfamily N-acetyltransferase